MPTQDEVIAKHLQDALAKGELQTAAGFGKPMHEDKGWEATPDALRMPFKILKRAGFVPAEVEIFRQRAELNAKLAADLSEAKLSQAERDALMRELSSLEQSISLRLEAMRTRG